MTETLTLTDASLKLGVHYMTVYKYVRTGRLPATKDGGQWRVSLKDLASFEAGDTTAPRRDIVPAMVADRLIAGDENGSFQLVESAMASGADAEEVYLDLIGAAMVQIGQRWHGGDLSIADEHLASATALRVVSRLGPRVTTRGRSKGTVLLASVSHDHHFLPTAILQDLLRFRGYSVINLGPNTPPESILDRAVQIGDELLAIGLNATTPGADDVVRVTISTLAEGLDVPLVVGGGAFVDTDHIALLGACHASSSARHALDLFDTIHAEARAR